MSIPRRHHYVPQVHIKNFKGKKFYYLVRKNHPKILNKNSSKEFYFQRDLNAVAELDGNINYEKLERELKLNWDDKFKVYLKDLLATIINSLIKDDYSFNVSEEIQKFFFEYGLMGRMRRLKMEHSFNEDYYDFKEGFPLFKDALESEDFIKGHGNLEHFEESKNQILDFFNFAEEFINKQQELPFCGIITSDAKDLVPDSCSCDIYYCDFPDYYFALPDCTSVIYNSGETVKINNQDINKIHSVGIALNPNLFIRIKNNSVVDNTENRTFICSREEVKRINQESYSQAFSEVLSNDLSVVEEMLTW